MTVVKAYSPDAAAVVLGGYVNGYGIMRSLHEAGISPIVLIDVKRHPAHYSRLTTHRRVIRSWKQLPQTLWDLRDTFDLLVLYPTSDVQLDELCEHESQLRDFCFLPFNPRTYQVARDKTFQYAVAQRLGIPTPKTISLVTTDDIAGLQSLRFPILLKPSWRVDSTGSGFRNLQLSGPEDFHASSVRIGEMLEGGVSILASEIIPGRDENIYAFTAYRSPSSGVLRHWTGRKLSQYPDSFGVFATAASAASPVVESQGIALINELDCYGICEPEFKLDPRDNEFKLMEINFRSMMWHRVGALAGVNLPDAQWRDAQGVYTPTQEQSQSIVSVSYFVHEFQNLFNRPDYSGRFLANLRYGRREWAFWNIRDPLPFISTLGRLFGMVVSCCLRRLVQR